VRRDTALARRWNHNVLARRGANGTCEYCCDNRVNGTRAERPANRRGCVPCVSGTKWNSTTVPCTEDGDADEDDDESKDSKCEDDTIPDPREGPQQTDVEAKDLKCTIDDRNNCKAPQIPETRPDGKENDSSFKPRCLNSDEKDKTTCDAKQQFMEITASPDGKAKKTCRPTRKYERKKKERIRKLEDKFRDLWESRKADRAKKDQEKKERKQKAEEERKQQEKTAEDKKKKKAKSYKCGMTTAMVAGQEIAGLIPANTAGSKGTIKSYMDMTACYFDAEFVDSDEFLGYWPSDVKVDDIGIGVVGCFTVRPCKRHIG